MKKSLYTGTGGVNVVGRSRLWYIITLTCIVISLLAIAIRGFSLSIDFEGGTRISMPAGNLVTNEVQDTFINATGVTPELTQIVGAGDSRVLEINSERLSEDQINSARQAIYDAYHPEDAAGQASPDVIGDSTVSESWGSTITERMLLAVAVFLVLVFIYITLRLQRTMAIAGMVALLVDAIVIAGIYALFGFEVSPATVIGLLTVLSFSIYDTVIVFDKVRENTAGLLDSHRRTFAEQVNLAVNQTLMRSISTSVISALPILALMVVAVWLLGVGTLKDLALIQLIGVIEGVFSSIFLATPLLVTLENRRKDIKAHNRAVERVRQGLSPEEDQGDDEESHSDESAPTPAAKIGGPSGSHRSPGASWRPHRS
ncbi:protein translocase subunit SecF [Corynebacterium poyangense]|uniref:Protein-export membrane protein SecF n=1 Tax=Corynebacterium poyangense TaxID=2684405 RepID=A0A7H0SP51_9CORY|nr:protein translocase subunit SecF [Corynebacterium poyangense]QNQ90326.1 protein translocase subunit SecF [Corynebacterium poyangense]